MSRRKGVLSTHPPQQTEKGNTSEDEEHFSDAQKLTQGWEGFDLKMPRGVNRWRAFLALLHGFTYPDPGSVAFLTPGSRILDRFFPDPGSQTHIFESLVTFFWVKVI
jgi:hypothetical protein